MTPQRLAVLEYIYVSKTHPSAQDIYQALLPKFNTLSLATIYNNLNALIELGYVIEMTYGDAATRYDYKEDDDVHYHAICETCGYIIDFSLEELDNLSEMLKEKYKFITHSQRLEAFGQCYDCQSRTRKEKEMYD
ncbi:transcriptional repressor [Granulicatella sp. 19428wC4_WM01]|nr:transcriptional repressor [Granulicatella sp. 19428wC4_WM01]